MNLTSDIPMPTSETDPVRDTLAGTPVLSVLNLTTAFWVNDGWKTVIRNISFDVGPRETVAIVGETGSGKSVTSLSIMRLLLPNSSKIEGNVLLNGRELLSLEEEQTRRRLKRNMAVDELNSPIRPIGFQVPKRVYREGSPGHLFQAV